MLVCDYFCAPAMRGEPTRLLLQTARELGARTYFDTAWDTDGFTAATREEIHAILPLVDVFLPNEAEARALDGHRIRDQGRPGRCSGAPAAGS